MLIDTVVPEPDALERHHITILASPEAVYDALWSTDFRQMRSVRWLLALRALPSFLMNPRQRRPPKRRFDLQDLESAGFGKLVESPGHEIVFGVTGCFWRPVGNILPFHENAFDGPVPPGLARAAWNFAVVPADNHSTTLSTETRIVCGDSLSRLKFRLYWLVVRPFSGLIRRVILKLVKRSCENLLGD